MLKSCFWASHNWKTPSGSIFIAIFDYANGWEILHSFAKLQYLPLYLRLWVEIQHTNEVRYPDIESELICPI